MSSIIVPLVKCKSGDLTDINNYRAITLSNAITKILETVLLENTLMIKFLELIVSLDLKQDILHS